MDSDARTTDTDPGGDADTTPEDRDGDGATTDDCNDADPAIHPGATEVCDGVDDDCDGLVDAEDDTLADGVPGWTDADGDEHGDPALPVVVCDAAGLALVGDDCDDGDGSAYPGAVEACRDEVDNDCDGELTPCTNVGDYGIGVDLGASVAGGKSNGWLGWEVRAAGDVDGDALDDFVVSDFYGTSGKGTVYLFGAGMTGVRNTSGAIAAFGGDGAMLLGSRVGDFNGDGVIDLAVADTNGTSSSRLLAWYGPLAASRGTSDVDAALTVGLEPFYSTGNGGSVAADFNADGTDDLVVPVADTKIVVQLGPFPASGATAAPIDLDVDPPTVIAGSDHLRAADIDGDGMPDLLRGELGDGVVAMFLGADVSSGTDPLPAVATIATTSGGTAFGTALAAGGDVNGDGYEDIVASSPTWGATGRACTFVGPFSGNIDDTAALACVFAGAGAHTGTAVAILDDFDADGADEVAITDNSAGGGGIAGIWYGPPVPGSIDTADLVLRGSGAEQLGGSCQIAGVGDVVGNGTADLVIDCLSCSSTGGFWFIDL